MGGQLVPTCATERHAQGQHMDGIREGMVLTDTLIKRASPRERDHKLSDEKGLYLLLRLSGSRLWWHKYCVAGKERVSSCGLQRLPRSYSRWSLPRRIIAFGD
jgi:hypothetical protein